MKYGTTLIAVACIMIITTVSGLPLGWKKGMVIIGSIIILFIGWIIHSVAKRKRAKREHTEHKKDTSSIYQEEESQENLIDEKISN